MKFFTRPVKRIFSHQLVTGSVVMVMGTMIGGLINYLYHLFMGRMLGPVYYGILASMISLMYLLNIPMGTLNLVLVKFVSSFKGKKEMGTIRVLFRKINKKLFPLSLLMFLVFLLASPLIVSFLHLNSIFPLVVVAFIFLVNTFATINRAVLQGLLRFGYFSLSVILEAILKLASAILLVNLGLKANGAVMGLLIGLIVAYFFTLLPLRVLPRTEKKASFSGREMLSYSLPVFLSFFSFTSLYTTDIILARHFLPAQQAGFYSSLAVLGKIIFFSASPIIGVMFPMVSERHSNGKESRDLLVMSFVLVSLICLAILSVYFFFPSLMVKTLFGAEYLEASPYLFVFGIFLSFYTLSYLLANFYLSIKKIKVVSLFVLAASAQVFLIFLFHQSLSQIIWVSIFVSSLLFGSLLLYLLKGRFR